MLFRSLLTLHFVKTTDNLADFLTREGLPLGDCEKLNLKQIQVEDFYDKLPQPEFSLIDWINYVNQHPEYLTILNGKNQPVQANIASIVLSLQRGIENVKDVLSPIEILKERLTRANIILAQKQELSEIYNYCLSGENFVYITEIGRAHV